MNAMTPAFMARGEDQKAFEGLLENVDESKHFFVVFLKKQIETMDITRKSRHLCETYRID